MEKKTQEQKEELTLAECLHQVYESVVVTEDDDDIFGSDNKSTPTQSVERPDAAYEYLQNVLQLTAEQVTLFAVIFEKALDGRTTSGTISKALGVTRTKFLTWKPDLDALYSKRLISYCPSRIGSSTFTVPKNVVNAIAQNQNQMPQPESKTLTVSKFAGQLNILFNNMFMEGWEFSDLADEIKYLYSHNRDNYLVKAFFANNLNCIPEYEWVLFSYLISKTICYKQKNYEFEEYARLFLDYDDFCEIRMNIEKGSLKLMQKGIVEHASEGGQESADLIRISQKALKEFIDQPTLDANRLLENPDTTCFNIIEPDKITPKELFFNEIERKEIDDLRKLLEKENFAKVVARMKDLGLRTGHAILFHGSPGTGKTEAAFQLARLTGRSILQVNVAQIRNKFVGESEKNLQEIFAQYRQAVKEYPIAPILFFNEADAILNTRSSGAQGAVEKMENSLQNILLHEMEHLDGGIMIATTNLAENLDAAFERRFISKIHFEKPSVKTCAQIWRNAFCNLSEAEAQHLAQEYCFTGAEIENVSRKSHVQYIINGTEPTITTISELCKAEKIYTQTTRHIGF